MRNLKKHTQRLNKMFDSITIKLNDSSNPLDIGYLAECLLFYEKTNLLVDKKSLIELLRFCGVNEVYELIQRGVLSIQTKGNILGAGQRDSLYFVDLFSVTNIDKHYETFYDAFFEVYEKRGKARRNAQRFIQASSPYVYDKKVVKDIRDSVINNFLVKKIINNFIKQIGLEEEFLGKEWNYNFVLTPNNSFVHNTNIDLDSLNKRAVSINRFIDFSPSSLILNLSESIGDIYSGK